MSRDQILNQGLSGLTLTASQMPPPQQSLPFPSSWSNQYTELPSTSYSSSAASSSSHYEVASSSSSSSFYASPPSASLHPEYKSYPTFPDAPWVTPGTLPSHSDYPSASPLPPQIYPTSSQAYSSSQSYYPAASQNYYPAPSPTDAQPSYGHPPTSAIASLTPLPPPFSFQGVVGFDPFAPQGDKVEAATEENDGLAPLPPPFSHQGVVGFDPFASQADSVGGVAPEKKDKFSSLPPPFSHQGVAGLDPFAPKAGSVGGAAPEEKASLDSLVSDALDQIILNAPLRQGLNAGLLRDFDRLKKDAVAATLPKDDSGINFLGVLDLFIEDVQPFLLAPFAEGSLQSPNQKTFNSLFDRIFDYIKQTLAIAENLLVKEKDVYCSNEQIAFHLTKGILREAFKGLHKDLNLKKTAYEQDELVGLGITRGGKHLVEIVQHVKATAKTTEVLIDGWRKTTIQANPQLDPKPSSAVARPKHHHQHHQASHGGGGGGVAAGHEAKKGGHPAKPHGHQHEDREKAARKAAVAALVEGIGIMLAEAGRGHGHARRAHGHAAGGAAPRDPQGGGRGFGK